MAIEAQNNPVATPQHFVPPTARQLRAQSVYRLQIGLFGLAAMLLLVGLASIIMERARRTDAESGIVAKTASAPAPARDPLVDIGVIPAAEPSAPPTVDPRDQ